MKQPTMTADVLARFWAKVNKNGPIHPKLKTACWEWTGCLSHGYGTMSINNKGVRMHRLSYALLVGPLIDGLVIDHLCRNRKCVNPNHLEQVTNRENTMRGENIIAKYAAQTHCHKGHPLSGENVRIPAKGGRLCLTCKRESEQALADKQRLLKAIAAGIETTSRECSSCGQVKNISEFPAFKGAYRRIGVCVRCITAKARKTYQRNGTRRVYSEEK